MYHIKLFFSTVFFYGGFSAGCFWAGRLGWLLCVCQRVPAYIGQGPNCFWQMWDMWLYDWNAIMSSRWQSLCVVEELRLRLVGVWPDLWLWSGRCAFCPAWKWDVPVLDKHHCTTTTTTTPTTTTTTTTAAMLLLQQILWVHYTVFSEFAFKYLKESKCPK